MVAKRLKFIPLIVSLLLLIPLIAMQFTNEVNWTLPDFVVAGILLLSAGFAVAFSLRKIKNKTYRILVPIVILLAILMIWAELAVGIFGTLLAGS